MLTTTEMVASLSEGLATTITRQVFERTIRPLMASEGDAQQHGGKWPYKDADLWRRRAYLQGREAMIRQGRWTATRPYSIQDRDAVALDLIDTDPQP